MDRKCVSPRGFPSRLRSPRFSPCLFPGPARSPALSFRWPPSPSLRFSPSRWPSGCRSLRGGRVWGCLCFAAALTACAVLASANVALAPLRPPRRATPDRRALRGGGTDADRRAQPIRPLLLARPRPRRRRRPRRGAGSLHADATSAGEEPFDTDRLDYRALLVYPLLIVPRSPSQSRPPLPYRRAWLGEDYEVWRLPPTATFRLLFHMPVGGPGDAAALPNCSETVGLGLLGLANQLGARPKTSSLVAAAPRRGARLGPTVAVPVDRASDLCGRRWDWIEAIGPAG